MTFHDDHTGRPSQRDDGRGRLRNPERRFGPDGSETMDIAFRLPLEARLKLDALRSNREASYVQTRALSDKRQRLQQTKIVIEDRLEVLLAPQNANTRSGQHGMAFAEDAAEVLDCRAQLADVVELLKKNARESSEASAAMGGVLEFVEDYVKTLRRGAITLFDGKAAVALPERNEAVQDAIEKIRARRRKLLDELQKAIDAPIHSTEAKRLMREQLANLIERGRPDLFDVVERAGKIKWPSLERPPIFMHSGDVANVRTNEFDALACFAWLNQNSLASTLESEIDKIADDKEALSAEQREKVTAKLRANILTAEYDEEALVVFAIERGLRVQRRNDADPRAVLGLSPDMPVPEPRFGRGAS